MILNNYLLLQPPAGADHARNAISHPMSSPKHSDIYAPKESRAEQHEGATSSGPTSSTSLTQPRPVAIPAPSRDLLPSQELRGTGSTTSLGLPEPGERKGRNESSLHQVDSSRERLGNATRPRTQVDLTASVQPPAKPSTPPPLPLKQPSASTSPLPPPPVPALAKMASSQPRRTLPYEPQIPSRTPSESYHPPAEDRGKVSFDSNSSVTSHGLSLPPDNRAAAAAEPPSLPQPVSAPRRLDKSNSRLIGSEGVQREATQATEEPVSGRNERKGPAAPEEYETRSDGAKRRKAEPNPPTSYTHKQTPTESAVERTYSSNPGRGSDSSAIRSSEMGKSRGKVEKSSDSAPPLGRKESHYTPPSAPTQIQSENSNNVSSVTPQPLLRPPSVADSIVNTPSGGSFQQGYMKPSSSSSINQAKLHQWGLSRGYSFALAELELPLNDS